MSCNIRGGVDGGFKVEWDYFCFLGVGYDFKVVLFLCCIIGYERLC